MKIMQNDVLNMKAGEVEGESKGDRIWLEEKEQKCREYSRSD